MSCLARALVFMTTLIPVITLAETREVEQVPSMELLEFLSEWETEQGEWEGPALFEDDSFEQLYESGGDEIEEEIEDVE
jgi:hypothetical protein